jgi:hypothetical protein
MKAVRAVVHFRDWRSVAELVDIIYGYRDRSKEESVRRACKKLAAEGYYVEIAYRSMKTGKVSAQPPGREQAVLVARRRAYGRASPTSLSGARRPICPASRR